MWQTANTYTIALPDGDEIVVGPDQYVDGWSGFLMNVTSDVPIRMIEQERAMLDGSLVSPGYAGSRSVVMDVLIADSEPALRAARLARISKLMTGMRNDVFIKWTEADGLTKQVSARVVAYPTITHTDGPAKQVQMSFRCGNPFIVSQKVNTADVTPGNVATLDNAGQWASYPVIYLYGAGTGFSVQDMVAGRSLDINTTLPNSNEFLRIDTYDKTVLLGGNPLYNRYGAVDINNEHFPFITPGSSTQLSYVVTNPSGTPKMRVTWRHSWL